MTTKWHFNVRRPCDRMRDSANDAFFTAESLENLSEALVREGIQNSLDAACRGEGEERQVRVRIALHAKAEGAASEYLREQFSPVNENFARGLGMESDAPLINGDVSYLVFEDFGTRGLTGDVSEYRLERAEKNAFFSFFRAEGRSAKTGDSLGRWGIGKQVFPTASRLHAIFGLTRRDESPNGALMGSAVIRSHSVRGKDFQPDAWFGCREQEDQPVQPVTDESMLTAFSRTFGLKRTTESGLSVVVPALDERVTSDDLRRGIVRSFFWPILLGELVVELEADNKAWLLDAETLPSHRELLPAAEASVIEFASWAAAAKPVTAVALCDDGANKPSWAQNGDQLLPESKIAEIRQALETAQRVYIKVPVIVRPKNGRGPEARSFFSVYISACRDSGHRPLFLRDGIVITDIRPPNFSGTRSLVVIDDRPLAGLLGDAEGVNHTQWQKDSQKFHNRYIYGPDTIRFVTRSVFEIMQRVHATETRGDPNLLLDIFFLPSDVGATERRKKPELGPPAIPPETPPSPPPAKPKCFLLQQVKGGFEIKPGNTSFHLLPARLRIEAGYAVRRGNPFNRWAAEDFVFSTPPLRHDPKPVGVVVVREEGNVMEVEIRKPEFLFGVSGFDAKRDLVVRAFELKGSHEADV